MSWAEDESSEDEAPDHISIQSRDEHDNLSDEESNSESESDVTDDEAAESSLTSNATNVPDTDNIKQKKPLAKTLSKKEKKQLREKELDDLDSLLADFDVQVNDKEAPSGSTTTSDVAKEGSISSKSKKKKKKKGSTPPKESDKTEYSSSEVVFDVKNVQNRTKKTKKKNDNVALSEALKETAKSGSDAKRKKEKKKRDKQHYNEMPS